MGFCLELALRPGTQHSVSQTECNIERVLPMAVKLTKSQAAAAATDTGTSGRDTPWLAGCVVAHQGLGLRAASSTERSSSVVRSFMAGS